MKGSGGEGGKERKGKIRCLPAYLPLFARYEWLSVFAFAEVVMGWHGWHLMGGEIRERERELILWNLLALPCSFCSAMLCYMSGV